MVICNRRYEQCGTMLHVTEDILLSIQDNFRTDRYVRGEVKMADVYENQSIYSP